MWLCSSIGFFSLVKKGGVDTWQVRARVKRDIENLCDTMRLPRSRIIHTTNSDYAWRLQFNRAEKNAFFDTMNSLVDYSNFKSEVGRHSDQSKQLHIYHKWWSDMAAIQETRPYSGSYSASSYVSDGNEDPHDSDERFYRQLEEWEERNRKIAVEKKSLMRRPKITNGHGTSKTIDLEIKNPGKPDSVYNSVAIRAAISSGLHPKGPFTVTWDAVQTPRAQAVKNFICKEADSVFFHDGLDVFYVKERDQYTVDKFGLPVMSKWLMTVETWNRMAKEKNRPQVMIQSSTSPSESIKSFEYNIEKRLRELAPELKNVRLDQALTEVDIDSISAIEMVMFIEQEFKIVLSDSDLESCKSFGDVLKLIQGKAIK
jgi:acyl carrier protein